MPTLPFRVPHALPRDEAATRLLAGVPKLEKALPGGAKVAATRVGDDRMLLKINVMAQTINVDSVLTADAVAGTVDVPLMMTMMGGQITQMVESAVARMLAAQARD